jgi:hypothetical protein
VAKIEPLYAGGEAGTINPLQTINPLHVSTRFSLVAGYLATALVVVAFIWLFANLLLRAPEFYPAWDQRNFYELARVAQSKVQAI